MSGDPDDPKGGAAPDAAGPKGNEESAPAAGGTAGGAQASPNGAGAEPAKTRRKPAQRKSTKRKIRPKPKIQAVKAPSSAKAPSAARAGNGQAGAAPGKAAEGKAEPEGMTTAKPASGMAAKPPAEGGARRPGAAEAAAPSPSEAAKAKPSQAVVAPRERSATESVSAERRRSGVPWVLLLFVAAMAGVGYWIWREQGPRLLQTVGVAPSQTETAPSETPQTEEVELPGPPALPLAQVAELERLLARLGFDPGDVDGIVDQKTREAISQFQEWDGQTADGEPSEDLLAAVREVASFQGGDG